MTTKSTAQPKRTEGLEKAYKNEEEGSKVIDEQSIDKKLLDWIYCLGFNPILITDLVTLDYFKVQGSLKISGIILSGGNDINKTSLRYKIEKKLAAFSKSKKIPLLGICHGLQFINCNEGGTLKKIKNHVRNNHKIILPLKLLGLDEIHILQV